MRQQFVILLVVSLLQYSSALKNYAPEQLRVLNSYLSSGLMLTCPDTGSPQQLNTIISESQVFWVNEAGQSEKPDGDVLVTSENLLTPNRPTRFEYIFTRPFTDISCGYFVGNTNKYVRIKRWKLSYVESARVALDFAIDDKYFKIASYNQTFNQIDYLRENSTLAALTESGNIIRPYCKVNFDMPLSSTLIWLYYNKYEGNKLIINETWRRLDSAQFTSRQDFLDTNNNAIEFINILKNLFNNPENSVTVNLQCATYVTGDMIIAKTHDYYLVRGRSGTGGDDGDGASGGLTQIELILIIIFSILGFFILLALLILLLYCCCFGLCCAWCTCFPWCDRKNKRRENREIRTATKRQQQQQRQVDVVGGTPIPIRSIESPRQTYRSSLHLDNINQQQKHEASMRFHNNNDAPSTSLHITAIPNAQRNELLMQKNAYPNNFETILYANDDENKNAYAYDSHYYRDRNNNGNNYIYKKEVQDFYEVKTIRSMPPSVSGRVPLDYAELVHQV